MMLKFGFKFLNFKGCGWGLTKKSHDKEFYYWLPGSKIQSETDCLDHNFSDFRMSNNKMLKKFHMLLVNLCQKRTFFHLLNPKYNNRLFIELRVQYMLCTKIVLNVKTKTKNESGSASFN